MRSDKDFLSMRILLQDMGFEDVYYDQNINWVRGAPSWACEIAEKIIEAGWRKAV